MISARSAKTATGIWACRKWSTAQTSSSARSPRRLPQMAALSPSRPRRSPSTINITAPRRRSPTPCRRCRRPLFWPHSTSCARTKARERRRSLMDNILYMRAGNGEGRIGSAGRSSPIVPVRVGAEPGAHCLARTGFIGRHRQSGRISGRAAGRRAFPGAGHGRSPRRCGCAGAAHAAGHAHRRPGNPHAARKRRRSSGLGSGGQRRLRG